MTIKEFLKANIVEFQRPNMFSVMFNPPKSNLNLLRLKPDYSSVFVRSVQIPGLTINTQQALYNNYKQNFAETIDLDDITMELACDATLFYSKMHNFFTEWMNQVINFETRLKNYKNDYVGTIDIEQHGHLGVIVGSASNACKLINAFPVNITPLELSHDSTDDILTFSVSFKFDNMKFTYAQTPLTFFGSLIAGAAGIGGIL